MRIFYCVEFLRFLTSLSILLFHYRHFFKPLNILSENNYDQENNNLPFYNFLKFFYENGNIGVPVFYVISGFVFSYVYLGEKKRTVSGATFFVNRFSRLYPLHFITLLFVLVLQTIYFNNFNLFQFNLINDIYHFFLQIFFISSWGFDNGNSFNGPIWSVSIEIAIYIIFFFLIKFLNSTKYYLSISIIIFLTLLDKMNLLSSKVLFIDCGRLFFSGVLIYFLSKEIKLVFLLKILSILLIFFSYFGNFKLFIFAPSLVLLFVLIEKKKLGTNLKLIFRNLGNLTYSMYLLHVPIQLLIILIFNYFEIPNVYFFTKTFFIFYFFLVFFISWLSFSFYEFPLNKYLRNKLQNLIIRNNKI